MGATAFVGRCMFAFVFLASAVAAALLTLGLAGLAGLHPSRLATRIQPATALHHD